MTIEQDILPIDVLEEPFSYNTSMILADMRAHWNVIVEDGALYCLPLEKKQI